MTKEKDYRVSYLLQHTKDQLFKIDRIEDGNIIFVNEGGSELDLKCSLPRKISVVEDGTVIEVTKKRFSMKDIQDPAAVIEDEPAAQIQNATPLGEQTDV